MFVIKHKYNSIKGLLLIVSLVLVVLPMVSVTFFMNNYFLKLLNSRITSDSVNVVDQLNLNLEREFAKIDGYLKTLCSSSEVREFIQGSKTMEFDSRYWELSGNIDKLLDISITDRKLFNNILIYSIGGPLYSFEQKMYINKNDIENEDWYEEVIKNKNKSYLVGIRKSPLYYEGKYYFVTARYIPNIKNLADGGIIICFSTSEFLQTIYSQLEKEQDIYIIDERGSIVVSSNQINELFIQQAFKNMHNHSKSSNVYNDDKYTMVISDSNSYGWRVGKSFLNNSLKDEARKVRNLVIPVFLLLIIAFLSFLLFIYNSLIRPLHYVVDLLNNSSNISKIKIPKYLRYENRRIGSGIITLVNKNYEIGKELSETQRDRKRMEISKLQAEINPHFIYNTLTSIKYIAILNKQEKISNLITSFVKLLKNSINREGAFILFKDELENLNHYIEIQKVIYNNNISFNFEIDESSLNCVVPNFILQPLVENSILHGILPKGREGLISISSKINGDKLIIKIIDNGVGLDSTSITDLKSNFNESSKFSGIGLSGINQKIKLIFSEEYGIDIESIVGEKTIVTILLPRELNNDQTEGGLEKGD